MPLFSKPVASVYVKELRTRLEPQAVPVFVPDAEIEVGDVGSFEDGRFQSRGNVVDRGLDVDVRSSEVGGFDFASSGKVEVGPTVQVPGLTGATLLKSTIRFTRSRAVVVSFKPGTELRVRDADAFADRLAELYYTRTLNPERAVVWSVRRAAGGTVIVSEAGDNTLDVLADSALLAPAGITIANLALGVTFGAERAATWKMSQPDRPLVTWIRLLRLRRNRVEDAFGFEPERDDLAQVADRAALEPVGPDELIRQLDDEHTAP